MATNHLSSQQTQTEQGEQVSTVTHIQQPLLNQCVLHLKGWKPCNIKLLELATKTSTSTTEPLYHIKTLLYFFWSEKRRLFWYYFNREISVQRTGRLERKLIIAITKRKSFFVTLAKFLGQKASDLFQQQHYWSIFLSFSHGLVAAVYLKVTDLGQRLGSFTLLTHLAGAEKKLLAKTSWAE